MESEDSADRRKTSMEREGSVSPHCPSSWGRQREAVTVGQRIYEIKGGGRSSGTVLKGEEKDKS